MREPVVLVVDDNEGFLHVLAEGTPALHAHGVRSGVDALAWLAEPASDPAFVVLDFHLPDMKAPAVLRRLRAMPRHAALPVLVLTQVDWPEDAAAALASGADHFDVKPSRVEPLTELVRGFWAGRVAPSSTGGQAKRLGSAGA